MEIYQVGKEYVDEYTVNKEIQKILKFLKREKRTYSMNIFLLKKSIDFLEREVKEIANTKIFQSI